MHLSQKWLEIERNGRIFGITYNVNDHSITFLNIQNEEKHKFYLSQKRLAKEGNTIFFVFFVFVNDDSITFLNISKNLKQIRKF